MRKLLPYIVIVVVLLVAGGIYIDKTSKPAQQAESVHDADNPPPSQDQSGPIELKSQGPAPDFTGITHWLNSDPLTIKQLRGKVVLVDFWTYSCINCIRTLPYVTKWYDTYNKDGFVVVGVHTPEFSFEKVTDNVQSAITKFGIHYPVAQDNDYTTWTAFNNQYWPAEYLIDQKGNIVHTHFGEGEYSQTEDAIRQLLGMSANVNPDNGPDLSGIQSPEMYFGTKRMENLSPDQQPSTVPKDYTLPNKLQPNQFALGGTWQFSDENITLTKPAGSIKLNFFAPKVNIVAASPKPVTVDVYLDGQKVNSVIIGPSQLYNLYSSDKAGSHILELRIPDSGFQAFTFTFG